MRIRKLLWLNFYLHFLLCINSYCFNYITNQLWKKVKGFYSSNLYSTEIKKIPKQYKQEYELTQEQRDSIIGIMLADGFLDRGKPTYNTRLRIDHTYPEQKSYVLSLRTLFAPLIASEPVIITRKADVRTGKIYKSIYVRTLRFVCLNKYYDLFYKDKIKVVPLNIEDLLTPIGLAHWLMGDGYLHNGVILICSESFTKEEQELLIAVLYSKFSIKATLNKRVSSSGIKSFRIRISKKSMNKLIILVKPYFISEMLYKLDL